MTGISHHSWQDSFSLMLSALKRAEWLQYEVDPEWVGFCEFGPGDIGGPFESLGVIRKRPQLAAVYLDPSSISALKKVFSDSADSVMGVPIIPIPSDQFAVYRHRESFYEEKATELPGRDSSAVATKDAFFAFAPVSFPKTRVRRFMGTAESQQTRQQHDPQLHGGDAASGVREEPC